MKKKKEETNQLIPFQRGRAKKTYDELDRKGKDTLYRVAAESNTKERIEKIIPEQLQKYAYNIYNLRDELMRRGLDVADEVYTILTSDTTPLHEKRMFLKILLPFTFEKLSQDTYNIKAEINNNVEQVIKVVYENKEIDEQ